MAPPIVEVDFNPSMPKLGLLRLNFEGFSRKISKMEAGKSENFLPECSIFLYNVF
jgi:hypothetical protein